MRKKLWIFSVIAVLLAAGAIWFFSTYAIINGNLYRRDVTTLNLSGSELKNPQKLTKLTDLEVADLRNTDLSPEEYEMLRNALPDCNILWLVPFQGDYLDPGSTTLTINSITKEEMALLAYFPNLKAIDMTGCRDTEAILEVQTLYPQCEISWYVPFQDDLILYNVKTLTLISLSEDDLESIRHFTSLKSVDARACKNLDAVMQLRQQYPDLTITWTVPIQNTRYNHDTATLELTDPDAGELKQNLQYLPQLKTVTLIGNIPDNEAIYELKQSYPEVEFIWSFKLCGKEVNSNDMEIDLSNIQMESVDEVENSLKYFNRLEKVVMCRCGIPSEDMDALWKRHPEIRFVWSAYIGGYYIRTDETTFMPWKLGFTRDGTPGMSNKAAAELKYLVDLVVIDIGHNDISDLSFLYYMPNVEYLMICCSGVSDLTPVGSLKKLKYLEIWENKITDLSPLANCTALEDINFTYTAAESLEPLFGLDLKNIWFSGWQYSKEQIQEVVDNFPNSTVKHKGRWPTSLGWRSIPNYFKQRDLLNMFYLESASE